MRWVQCYSSEVPNLRVKRPSQTPNTGDDLGGDIPETRVHQVSDDFHQHAAGPERGDGRGFSRGLRDCEEADLVFRRDAEQLGYLGPGGKGLWAYYRDHGIHPPEYLRKTVNRKELPMGDAVDLIEDGQ